MGGERLDASLLERVGFALNEADWLDFEVDAAARLAFATFSVLTLPPSGPAPPDPRVTFAFRRVGRVVASLREGRWDDDRAAVVPLQLHELSRAVRSFGGLPVYGWEFFDCEAGFDQWKQRLSLDWRSAEGGMSHAITLFQEGGDRHLDLRAWFDGFDILDLEGKLIPLDVFSEGGARWWDALDAGDERTQGAGIKALGPDDRVTCLNCGEVIHFPLDVLKGSTVECPGCGAVVRGPR